MIVCATSLSSGTIIDVIQKRYPHLFGFSVSSTSRAPRVNEVHGVHYHFHTIEEINHGIQRGEYIEHATVHTNKYGTTFKAVQSVQNQGKICILDIDIQGCQSFKASTLPAKYLFIMPPSMEELSARLHKRGTESEDKIKVRLANAVGEILYGESGNFDAIVVNNTVEESVEQILKTLREWYPEVDFDAPAPAPAAGNSSSSAADV